MGRIVKLLKFINDHGTMLLLIFAILAIILWLLVRYLNKQNMTDNKKSLIITTYSFSCILILLFFLRFWPPYGKSELLIAQGGGGGGVELNYGDTDFGKGDDYLNETLEVNMKEVAPEPEEATAPEEVLTQDNVGAEITTPPKVKNKPKEKTPTETKPVETPKTPVKKTNSALTNMIKGKNKGGDGNSNTSGNQGSANGNTNSNGYYGSGGTGGGTGGGNGTGNGTGTGPGSGSGSGGGNGTGNGKGTNFNLAGRRTAYIPTVDNDCNQAGRVTIEVTVDKSGKVISAVNGKGSTADACLIALAKKYALQTRWQPSETAADKQTGNITYNFSF
jgi:uncharacterized membrane protein YgcG